MYRDHPTRILYIEDDKVIASLLQKWLEGYSYVVDLAESGYAGLAQLQEHHYDVVAIDYHLPDINGLQVLKTLAIRNHKLPSIMVTGEGNECVAVEAMKLGVSDYLVKDQENSYLNLLPLVIEQVLEKRRIIEEKERLEKALYQSEKQLRAFFEGADDIVYFQELDGTLSLFNAQASRLTGYVSEDFKRDTQLWYRLIHPEDLKTVRAFFATHRNGVAAHELEYRLRTKQGQWRWIQVRMVGTQDEQGYYYGYNCIGRDITARKQAELALHKERDFTDAVLDTIATLVVVHDRQGRVIRFNKAAEKLTGYTAAEMKGRYVWDCLIVPEEKTAVKAIFSELAYQAIPNQYEGHWVIKDGTHRLIAWSNTILFDREHQRVEYVIGTGTDVTERRQAEQALRESEQTLRIILDATTESIALAELDTTCILINPAGAERLHRTVAEVIGHGLDELMPPEIARRNKIFVNQVIRTKQSVCFEDQHEEIWFEHSLSPVFDENGMINRIVIVSRDITEHKQTEKALRKSEQTLRVILDVTTDTILLIETDGTCVIINAAGATRFKKHVENIIGRCVYDLLPPEVAVKRRATIEQSIRTKQPIFLEDEWAEQWFENHCCPVLDDEGEVVRVAVFAHDITERKRAEHVLQQTLSEQEAILNNSMVGIVFVTPDRKLRRFNRKLTEIFGYTENELQGCSSVILYPSEADFVKFGKEVIPLFMKGEIFTTERLLRRKNGQLFWCRLLGKSIDDLDLSKGFIWTLDDITEKKHIEESLWLAATVFETATEAIFITNIQNDIIAVNPAFTTLTGYTKAEILGKSPFILSSDYHDRDFFRTIKHHLFKEGKWQGEIWNRRKNGEVYPAWLSVVAIRQADNRITQFVTVFSDITKRKQDEAIIHYQANFDALTDLPNRMFFMESLAQEILCAVRDRTRFALMFIDLDRFKWVNDNLGHHAGDQLLVETARRLKRCVRNTDIIARLGGDEFTVILPKIDPTTSSGRTDWNVKSIAERILNSLNISFTIESREIFISASIGISFFPEDGEDIETLMKLADTAMYWAKKQGRNNYLFYAKDRELGKNR